MMTSNKPYLIRAMFDWIMDNELTPYLLVDTMYPGVEVPEQHVSGGRMVLNLSSQACRGLHMDNDKILFTTKFSGVPVQILVPPGGVLSIYAKENGRGMEFSVDYEDAPPPPTSTSKNKKPRQKPALKLVE